MATLKSQTIGEQGLVNLVITESADFLLPVQLVEENSDGTEDPIDLTGGKIEANIYKPDGTLIESFLFTPINKPNGDFTLSLTHDETEAAAFIAAFKDAVNKWDCFFEDSTGFRERVFTGNTTLSPSGTPST